MIRATKILGIPALLAITVVILLALQFLYTPLPPPPGTTVVIRHGESFTRVAEQLTAAGVVAGVRPLRLLARLRGDTGRVQAGTYAFSTPATPGAVLDRLVAGDVVRVTVTIPEGWTLREIAARLDEKGLADRAQVLRLGSDPGLLAAFDLPGPTLEGYLFPETYSLAAGTPPRQILKTMVDEFHRRLTPDLAAAARARGLNVKQLVTLASIVQKEAGNEAEMPLIAAVFFNRLQRHMRLQSDPTVIYGIPDFDGNLTRADLERRTPYNTYRIAGLPPGPIANPGSAALAATAHPAAVDYLYFVSRGDGSHAFSATLAEHNRAVRRYQLHR